MAATATWGTRARAAFPGAPAPPCVGPRHRVMAGMRPGLARGAEPSMGLDGYHRLVRLLWWAAGMVLAGSIVTVIVRAFVSAVTGIGQ